MGGAGPGDGGRDDGSKSRAYLRFLHIGTQMALTLVLGVFGGMWLDGKLGSSPAFVVTGSVLGIGLGIAAVILEVGRARK